MKRSGPLYTLLAGLLLAAVMLSLNATTGTRSSGYGGGGAASASPAPDPAAPPGRTPAPKVPSASAAPTAPAPSASAPERVYAGRTDDDGAAVSVSVRDRRAVAYYCDGRTRESWLKGDVKDDGSMRLTGRNGAELTAVTRAGEITGEVAVAGRRQDFTAAGANRPSGLYRATNEVRGARIDGGWIVLQDGRQVGIVTRDGKPSAAPVLDPATGTAVVDNARLTARPVAP
ncbi:hypothetical protein ACFYVL_38050 [Streptomyces sp. NPDC004111]|uniref:hypothetical protein n=1 Tax=Streptomyces sp. NPDC004111 TaxID=3364690 RepID=UPI0036D0DE0A